MATSRPDPLRKVQSKIMLMAGHNTIVGNVDELQSIGIILLE